MQTEEKGRWGEAMNYLLERGTNRNLLTLFF